MPQHDVNEVVRGRLYDTRHKRVFFDGNVPHLALSWQRRTRISSVWSSRKNSADLDAMPRTILEDHEMALPGPVWVSRSTCLGSSLRSSSFRCKLTY